MNIIERGIKIRDKLPIMQWRKKYYEMGWYLVAHTSPIEDKESPAEWVKENLDEDDYDYFNCYFWAFKNEEDAIQFKMRWT